MKSADAAWRGREGCLSSMPDAVLSEIEVAILCGGMGRRLRSVVADRPKPMAVVGDRPFLLLLVEHLASYGFRRFVLCAGHLAEVIEEYFDRPRDDWDVTVVREEERLGTAGALRNASAALTSDPVLVLNGDSFCAVDYGVMLGVHRKMQASATLAVVPVESSRQYGSVNVDAGGWVRSFDEKAEGDSRGSVNAGVYMFGLETIGGIETRVPLSLERDVFPGLISEGLRAWPVDGPLFDIGTPERYERAQRELVATMKADRAAHTEGRV